ncbi:hypothetical protein [Prauserella flavalba]|uniref:Uncharacterized protein n=1 Tax=Prauserella flavalba TaxID=1477506 RepID=A0A318LID7_9PSEU|nr:hypothetical protein [Prauserella flavalba]PXY29760.1 hypothetical protein BA062_21550 [Prauserella flavalba]
MGQNGQRTVAHGWQVHRGGTDRHDPCDALAASGLQHSEVADGVGAPSRGLRGGKVGNVARGREIHADDVVAGVGESLSIARAVHPGAPVTACPVVRPAVRPRTSPVERASITRA